MSLPASEGSEEAAGCVTGALTMPGPCPGPFGGDGNILPTSNKGQPLPPGGRPVLSVPRRPGGGRTAECSPGASSQLLGNDSSL